MSELTDKAHEVGSLRHARDLLEHPGKVITRTWWDVDAWGRWISENLLEEEAIAHEQARAQSDHDVFQKEPRP